MANTPLLSSSPLLSTLSFLLIFIFLLSLYRSHPPHNSLTAQNHPCNFRNLETDEAKCEFFLSSSQCSPSGYINYFRLFYCFFGHRHPFGLAGLLLWLIFLFYLLGSTAATFFCSNLEGLSSLLKLSPAIAGTTLLSLGNGAPDVFSSIVSFGGGGGGGGAACDFGLNSVLGGALFVSTVVVGVVSVLVEARGVAVEKLDFVRDACFLLFVLLSLTAILVAGEISVWVALAFAFLYLIYILLVYITHRFRGILKIVSFLFLSLQLF